MPMSDLGLDMQVTVLALQGTLTQAEAKRLLEVVVGWVRMSTGGMAPHVWTYPLPDNGGGVGDTVVQPFIVGQPLIESIALTLTGVGVTDSWQEHGGFYLIIASCRSFVARLLTWRLRRAGWKVLNWETARATLRQKPKSWWKFGG